MSDSLTGHLRREDETSFNPSFLRMQDFLYMSMQIRVVKLSVGLLILLGQKYVKMTESCEKNVKATFLSSNESI